MTIHQHHEVTNGRVAREAGSVGVGGWQYSHLHMLDSVVLADNLKDLDQFADAVQQTCP
jgi:hypothetical protein